MGLKSKKDKKFFNSKNSVKIIAIIGPVGVGKTTIRKYLVLRLKERGVRIKESSIRLNHLFAYLYLLLVVRILNYKGSEPISTLGKYNPQVFVKLFSLWKHIMLLSLLIKYLISIYIPLKIFRKNVIVEDYLLVTICDLVWVATWFNIPPESLLNELSVLLKFLVKLPMKIVHLKATYENLVKRWFIRGSFERDKVYMITGFTYIKFHESCAEALLRFLHLDNNVIVLNTDNVQIKEIIESIIRNFIETNIK